MVNTLGDLNRDGWSLVPGVLDAAECEQLRQSLGEVDSAGRRGMLRVPAVALLAQSRLAALAAPFLASAPVPVRGIYFDKRPEANWLVAWHQDLTLALRERVESPGFGLWSVKDGVPHVQPPVALLERMVTARLHLDDADTANGALRVLPGTHLHGRLDATSIQTFRETVPEMLCEAKAGDVLLMRPLLLHASSRSLSARRRRVLHIEFAGFHLPKPLVWHEAPCESLQAR